MRAVFRHLSYFYRSAGGRIKLQCDAHGLLGIVHRLSALLIEYLKGPLGMGSSRADRAEPVESRDVKDLFDSKKPVPVDNQELGAEVGKGRALLGIGLIINEVVSSMMFLPEAYEELQDKSLILLTRDSS